MSQITCDVIQDLLPLYADEALSQASVDLVREHLSGCTECRKVLDTMQEQIPVSKPTVDPSAPLRQLKRRNRKNLLLSIFVVLLLCGGVVLWLLSPILWGPGRPDANSLTVTEYQDGTILITTDDRAKHSDFGYLYQLTEDGSLIMYFTAPTEAEQYWHDLGSVVNGTDTYDETLAPNAIEVREDHSVGFAGGINPGAGEFRCVQPNSIHITVPVKRVYFLDDPTGEHFDRFLAQQQEAWDKLWNEICDDNDNLWPAGTYLVPTDGFDFDALENTTLLWEKASD